MEMLININRVRKWKYSSVHQDQYAWLITDTNDKDCSNYRFNYTVKFEHNKNHFVSITKFFNVKPIELVGLCNEEVERLTKMRLRY